MRRMLSLVLTLICLLGMATIQAAPVEFTYTGYVKVQGSYFSGPGQFKFAIVNRSGSRSFWSNDGTSRNAAQPTASLPLNVIDGYFAVAIGDTEAGMDPLDAAAFNSEQQYYLRVWFNDGTHGFERLTPDQRIVNPALLGATQQSSTIIYVNPVTGDDANVGNVPDSPKKTIQAAWNTLPTIISTTATIQLQDGVYRGHTLLQGKTAVGSARIVINGNATTPSLTRVTGASSSNETSGTVAIGFLVSNQQGLILRHLNINYFTLAGVKVNDQSNAVIEHCIFNGIHFTGILGHYSQVLAENCEFGPTAGTSAENYGLLSGYSGWYDVRSSHFSNLNVAMSSGRSGSLLVQNCLMENLIAGGIELYANANISFVLPKSTIRNTQWGVNGQSNSAVSFAISRVNYSGISSQPVVIGTGAVNFFN